MQWRTNTNRHNLGFHEGGKQRTLKWGLVTCIVRKGGIGACCNYPTTLPSLLQRSSESVIVLVSSFSPLPAICCRSALLLRRERGSLRRAS